MTATLLTGIAFGTKSRTYTREALPEATTPRSDAQIAAALASGLDTPVDVLAAFYESSLGYVDTSPCEYVAPNQEST